ncbi:hypothetical protein PENSTE_c013G02956 [Penicillium steckii]|uniref:Protein kinase domain-containing protein n=1 Tax=Penicillium steckii TaxID=303698 RepID=A0A1V6T2R9_9EURO|nr:hypothetical protein PENSTE_c013G02956 [Penicillium steckii]
MEAAGLVLSVISLFGSCVKGYQLLSDVKSSGQDSAILLCRLQIEEKRLLIWGQTVGLAEETCRIPVQDFDTILTVLAEINSITQDTAVMKKRYGASREPSNEVLSHKNPIEYIQSSPFYQELGRRIDEKLRSPGHSLKTGLRWVFDRKDLEKLVVDLRELNNGLYALFEGANRLASLSRFNDMCLLSSASNDIEKLAIIRDASKSSYEGLSRTVDQRIHLLDLETSSREVPRSATQISLDQFVWIQSKTARSIAHFGEEVVFVEWREYADGSLHHGQLVSILDQRIAELSILLGRKPKPDGFQVMDCLGYCHDESKQRFGLVYNLPILETDKPPEIISLYDLIHPKAGTNTIFPSLNDRFLLSRMLANSLLQLHSTSWLHRNLRSSHILFVKSGNSMDWLKEPFISGFGYSRMDNPDAVSLPLCAQDEESAYQHPELADNSRIGYRKEYDAYSLGIILTEIGFWRPIFKFRKSEYNSKRNHRRLLEYQLSGDLAHRMGQQFEHAVRLLLTGKAYGDSKVEGEQLIAFSRDIVSQLELRIPS